MYIMNNRRPKTEPSRICYIKPTQTHLKQNFVSWNQDNSQRVIKGTKVIVVIKRMLSRDKDQTWRTDIYNKEHKKN